MQSSTSHNTAQAADSMPNLLCGLLNYRWVGFSLFHKRADYLLFGLVTKNIDRIKKGYSYR